MVNLEFLISNFQLLAALRTDFRLSTIKPKFVRIAILFDILLDIFFIVSPTDQMPSMKSAAGDTVIREKT